MGRTLFCAFNFLGYPFHAYGCGLAPERWVKPTSQGFKQVTVETHRLPPRLALPLLASILLLLALHKEVSI